MVLRKPAVMSMETTQRSKRNQVRRYLHAMALQELFKR